MSGIPIYLVSKSLANTFQNEMFSDEDSRVLYFIHDEDCMEKGKQFDVDVVIVDIRDDEGTALSLIKALHGQDGFENAFFLVVTHGGNLLQKQRCYEAGAHGYYDDTVEASEIITVLMIAYAYVCQSREENKVEQLCQPERPVLDDVLAEKTAMISFFDSLSSCDNYDAIVTLVFDFMRSLGLKASVQLRTVKATTSYCDPAIHAVTNPLEMELFDILKSKGREVEFGHTLLINFSNVSLFIKNPPSVPPQLERYKQHLKTVVRCLEASVVTVGTLLKKRKENDKISAVLKVSSQILPEIDRKQVAFKGSIERINSDLLQQLTKDLMSLKLSSEQEGRLLELVNDSLQKSLAFYLGHQEDEGVLRKIVQDLNLMMEKSVRESVVR